MYGEAIRQSYIISSLRWESDKVATDFETRSLPTFPRCFPRSVTFFVARPIRSIVSRQLPLSSSATHRGFAFYVVFPRSPIPLIARCSMLLIPSVLLASRRAAVAPQISVHPVREVDEDQQ